MAIISLLPNDGEGNFNRKVYSVLIAVILVLGFFLALGALFPAAVSLFFHLLWILIIIIVLVFLTLGALVLVGMREQVSKILDLLLEGSLTILDFVDFIKKVWTYFKRIVRDFAFFATAPLAYLLSLAAYLGLLIMYKSVGKTYDVTLLTVALSFFLVLFIGILNRPKLKSPTGFSGVLGGKFQRAFSDGFEIFLFLFFLTMDSTHLFFLPEGLNHTLTAQIGDYDLMIRSFHFGDNLTTTLNLIAISIFVEVVRNALRLVLVAKRYYAQKKAAATSTLGIYTKEHRTPLLKQSLRLSFNDAKDDFIKLIAFSTVILAVFLLFPRLKLLALAVVSVTNLFLDVLLHERITMARPDDLVTRTIAKIFRL